MGHHHPHHDRGRDALNATGRLSSPTLIGREDELASLHELLDAAAPGGIGLVLVAGDAGIGKSRLVEEFSRRVRSAGNPIVSGGCLDIGEGAVPYAPLVGVLRELLRDEDASRLARALGPTARELWRLAPDLLPREAPGTEDTGPLSQAQLFSAVVRLLEHLGGDSPAVVVLEDLHWADGSTRELLTYLARTPREGHTLIVGTYRSDDLHRTHPLRRLLHELLRLPVVARMELEPFGEHELGEQLRAITGEAADRVTVERLLERSAGNPFYVEELVAAGGTGDGPLPENLRDLLVDRWLALPQAAQNVLRVASAFGRDIDDATLAAVWAGDEEPLLQGLREALASGLLVQDEDGELYRFRHALAQEAVYGELLPPERRNLHRSIAEVLTSRPMDGPRTRINAELARHWREAREHAKALGATVDAARDAEEMLAFTEAARHYEHVLDLWDEVDDPAVVAGFDRYTALLRAAEASALTVSMTRAMGYLRLAAEELGEDPDPTRLAVLYGRQSRYHWLAGEGGEALEAAEQAVRLMPTEPPSKELAWMLAEYGRLLMLTDAWEASREPSERAVEVARAVGARAEEGQALNSLGCSLVLLGERDAGIAHLRGSLRIAHEVRRAEDIDRAYINLNAMLGHAERFEEAVEVGLEGLQRLRDLGARWPLDAFLRVNVVEGLYFLGRWQEAEELLASLPTPEGRRVTALHYLLARVELALARGRLDEAGADLEEANELSAHVVDSQFRGPMLSLTAGLAVQEGRWDDVEAATDASIELMLGAENERFLVEPLAMGLRGEADRAVAARAAGDAAQLEASSRRGEELITLARRIAATTVAAAPEAARWRAELALCEAEHTRLEGRSDPAAWAHVADLWAQGMMRHVRCYALWRAAEASLAGDGDREAAQAWAAEAYAIATQLGAGLLVQRISELCRRARLELGAAPVSGGQVEEDGDLGLTPREREVLALVATGMTNRAIGERLYISAKTASVHVSNILSKLGVSTRTEAAAVAHQRGLTDLSRA